VDYRLDFDFYCDDIDGDAPFAGNGDDDDDDDDDDEDAPKMGAGSASPFHLSLPIEVAPRGGSGLGGGATPVACMEPAAFLQRKVLY
jgi:hypothetical protein